MPISIIIATKAEIIEEVQKLLISEFKIEDKIAEPLAKRSIKSHIDIMVDDSWFLIECPYVDRVYRDSYYHYFSSKSNEYPRDCIRVSIFRTEIKAHDFRNEVHRGKLQNNFLGFFILRPTGPNIMGRSVINPEAFKNHDFELCIHTATASINSVKLAVQGFPHSSQDIETMTCAETSIWALMEYFGTKYPEYRPIKPFKITDTLNSVSAERLTPSRGLNITQMAFALKQFGFGSRIYSKDSFKIDFERLLSCYIESGIPLIVAIQNTHAGGNIGHALLCIGHESIKEDDITKLGHSYISDSQVGAGIIKKGVSFFDNDDIKKKFIFIDDNHSPYTVAPLDNPAICYAADPNWKDCEVTFFIVPLYKKIYLEAYEAKNFVMSFLVNGSKQIPDKSELYLRMFLTSSRSYKDTIATQQDLQDDVKSILLETNMGRFIWVAELSTKDLIKTKKANGLIILDATEPNVYYNKPLKFAAYGNNLITFDPISNKLTASDLPLHNFSIYTKNLKGF